MEVFLTTSATTPMRSAMFALTKTYWQWNEEFNLAVLQGSGLEFQKQRRILAESKAKGPYYICADDDCLPQPFSMTALLATVHGYPQFGMLSFLPANANIEQWKPECSETVNGCVYEDHDVMEHVSVGGIRVMQAGAMKEWPEMEPGISGYDRVQADYLRAQGLRVGYLKRFLMNHIGEGHSTVWRI
jgi:hypothetical protein